MRVWFGMIVDREFHDGVVHPSPQWAVMARDSLTARGYQLTDDDPVIHWDEITDQVAAMSASGMKAGDYWLRIGFTEVPGDVVAEEGIG
jgi:hypothetical protein